MTTSASTFKGRVYPWLLLSPTLIVSLVFLYYPTLATLRLSTYKTAFMGTKRYYVGTGNFTSLVTSPDYRHSVVITFLFALLVVAASLILGLAISLLLFQRVRGKGFYTSATIWVYAMPPAVAGTIWLFVFHPTVGIASFFMQKWFGVSWDWISDGAAAFSMVTAAAVWKDLGYNVIFLLAALQNLPAEILEAASIDGAGPWTKLKTVMLPMISPTILFLVVTDTIYAFFDSFSFIDIMTKGGPVNATNTLIYKLYYDAFQQSDTGTAAAESIILFAIVFVLMVIQFRVGGKQVHYGG